MIGENESRWRLVEMDLGGSQDYTFFYYFIFLKNKKL